MSADVTRVLATGMYWRCDYIVCRCSAWNARDAWHIRTYHDKCYGCGRPLFRTEESLIQDLGKHLWDKAYAEYQKSGERNIPLMDLAMELGRVGR